MLYNKNDITDTNSDIIYLSTSKESIPYKLYMEMKQEFRNKQFKVEQNQSKHDHLSPIIFSDNRSIQFNMSSNETLNIGGNNSDDDSSTIHINNIKVEDIYSPNVFNTSDNNDDFIEERLSTREVQEPTLHVVPMTVDMSTQFNSDMKIVVEQDTNDKNIINIRFGGTFTGSLAGGGSIPQEALLSLINENIREKYNNENNIPKSSSVEQKLKIKPVQNSKKPSIGSEESIDYFASTKPVDPVVSKTDSGVRNRLSQNNLQSNNIIENKAKSVPVPTPKYNEQNTENLAGTSWLPSISFYSKNLPRVNIPAVLPTCIVRRIVRAMLSELQLPSVKTNKKNKLEEKIPKLTSNPQIINLNWHLALKRSKIMIGELIELILSVNIDNSKKSYPDVKQVMMELKTEFISCCIYLSGLTDDTKVLEKLCLELCIDQISDEIDRLLESFTNWMKTGMKSEFSTYFINEFTNSISPNVSMNASSKESTTKTLSQSVESTATPLKISQISQPSKIGRPSITQDNRRQSIEIKKPSQEIRRQSVDIRKSVTETRRQSIDTRQSGVETSPDVRQPTPDNRRQSTDVRQTTPDNRRQSTDVRQPTPDNRRQSIDVRQPTPDNRRQSIDIKQLSPDNRRPSVDARQSISGNRRQSVDIKQPIADNRRQSTDIKQPSPDGRRQSVKSRNEDSNETAYTTKIKSSFADPSIITNSRVKKTMNNISISAVEQNITNKSISRESRNQMIPVQIVNDQPIILRNSQVSLIKELTNQTELWKKPVAAGKNSIQDLIEFIINSIAQDKQSTKELYNDIIGQLNNLEKELIFSVANNLQGSRLSNNDLQSLCYEILAEIIFEEMALAKYIFSSLNPIGVDNMMLGKLYRNYSIENAGMKENSGLRNSKVDSYAHHTSEIKNYSDTNVSVDRDKLKSAKTQSQYDHESTLKALEPDQPSKHDPQVKNHSADHMMMSIDSTVPLRGSEIKRRTKSITETNTITKTGTMDRRVSNLQNPVKTIETPNFAEGNSQLVLIINKLNNQTNEINKIKETLKILSGNVEEKLSTFSCHYPQIEVNQSGAPDQNDLLKYGKSTNIYNTQEVIPPSIDLVANVQPSVYMGGSQTNLNGRSFENKSFIAPISTKSTELRVGAKDIDGLNTSSNLIDIDVLKLIGDGAHNLLTSKKMRNNPKSELQRRDSCKSFNTEFDKIFEWIVTKYEETLASMVSNSASKKIVEALNTAPNEERRKIERELINRIIDQHNLTIHKWVKDICFQKVLNCLS